MLPLCKKLAWGEGGGAEVEGKPVKRRGSQHEIFFTALPTLTRDISNLCIDGIVTSVQGEINDIIIQYYKNLFSETITWLPKLDGLVFPCLDSAKVDWLERSFQERKFFRLCLAWMVTKCRVLAASLLLFLVLLGYSEG